MSLHRRPQVEELGERILPSALPLAHHVAALGAGRFGLPPSLGPLQPHTLAGNASGSGTYTAASPVPDVGVDYTLQGIADLSRFGHVHVEGFVNSLGNIVSGHASGRLTFSNHSGSVTVELTGPLQSGFAPLPQSFQYQVIGGRGAYQHFTDHGSLMLTFQASDPAHGAFTLTMPGLPPPTPPSGVSGQALFQSESIPLNPPVARQLLPLAGAVIEIESADGSTVVAQTVTDSNGMFSIRLPPGHYILVPLSPGPLFVGNLRGTPQNFDVQAGVFTTVDAGYYSLFQFG